MSSIDLPDQPAAAGISIAEAVGFEVRVVWRDAWSSNGEWTGFDDLSELKGKLSISLGRLVSVNDDVLVVAGTWNEDDYACDPLVIPRGMVDEWRLLDVAGPADG